MMMKGGSATIVFMLVLCIGMWMTNALATEETKSQLPLSKSLDGSGYGWPYLYYSQLYPYYPPYHPYYPPYNPYYPPSPPARPPPAIPEPTPTTPSPPVTPKPTPTTPKPTPTIPSPPAEQKPPPANQNPPSTGYFDPRECGELVGDVVGCIATYWVGDFNKEHCCSIFQRVSQCPGGSSLILGIYPQQC